MTAMYTDLDQAPEFDRSVPAEEFYRATSLARKVAMREKRAKGEVMHKSPLGYKNARDAEGRSVIVPDPELFPLVEEARRMRAEGNSIREICRVMEAKGLRSRSGKIIKPGTMHFVLTGS